MGNQNVTLETANSSTLADGGTFNIQTSGSIDLSGLTFSGNQLSVVNGTHQFRQGTLQFTTLDLTGISFGPGVFISGGTVTNIDADNFDNPGPITFTPVTVNNSPVNPILNIEGLRQADNTANITDWNTSGAAMITADSTLVVTVTSAQSTQFSEGTNVTFNVAPVEYSFTFDNNDFRGRAAIAHRDMGTTNAWTYTTIEDFTTTAPSLSNIDSNHAGFGTNQEVAVLTVGAGYTLTVTMLERPAPMFAGTINVTVRTTADPLWNQTAANGLEASMSLEELVKEGSTNGTIAITVTGSPPSDFLTTGETNGLLGLARNDVDYLTEILDSGMTTDFITFRGDTGGSTVTNGVEFRKADLAATTIMINQATTADGATTLDFDNAALTGATLANNALVGHSFTDSNTPAVTYTITANTASQITFGPGLQSGHGLVNNSTLDLFVLQQVVSDVQGFNPRVDANGIADVLNYPNVSGISSTDVQNAVDASTAGRTIAAARTANSGFLKANSPRI